MIILGKDRVFENIKIMVDDYNNSKEDVLNDIVYAFEIFSSMKKAKGTNKMSCYTVFYSLSKNEFSGYKKHIDSFILNKIDLTYIEKCDLENELDNAIDSFIKQITDNQFQSKAKKVNLPEDCQISYKFYDKVIKYLINLRYNIHTDPFINKVMDAEEFNSYYIEYLEDIIGSKSESIIYSDFIYSLALLSSNSSSDTIGPILQKIKTVIDKHNVIDNIEVDEFKEFVLHIVYSDLEKESIIILKEVFKVFGYNELDILSNFMMLYDDPSVFMDTDFEKVSDYMLQNNIDINVIINNEKHNSTSYLNKNTYTPNLGYANKIFISSSDFIDYNFIVENFDKILISKELKSTIQELIHIYNINPMILNIYLDHNQTSINSFLKLKEIFDFINTYDECDNRLLSKYTFEIYGYLYESNGILTFKD